MKIFSNLGRRGLYRSRRGVLLGVCRGLAEYFDFSVIWVRILTVIAFIITGFWPVGVLYLIMALIMKPAPATPPRPRTRKSSITPTPTAARWPWAA